MCRFDQNKQKGMVLITTLLFLQMIVILGMYSLDASRHSLKISQHIALNHSLFRAADSKLSQIERELIWETKPCVIAMTHPESFISQSLEWWSSFACYEEDDLLDYYYVVEYLGQDACLDIKESEMDKITAAYLRITLLLMTKNKNAREFLQSTMIKMDNAKHPCTGNRRQVVLGRQALFTF